MTSLWSSTKTAVNNGYGMSGFARIGLPNPYYKPRPWGISGIHPELLEQPPYAQNEEKHRMVTRGGSSLIKGSREAKARMAYLRSLRGRGCRKTSSKRKLRGGDMSWFKPLLESLGGTAMNAIKQLAMETGASLTELLADPKGLVEKLMAFAPAAANTVKNLFSGGKKDKTRTKRQEYLRMLKQYDPELYEKKRKEAILRKREQVLAKMKKIQQQKLLKLKKYGLDTDPYDDFDNNNNDNSDDMTNDNRAIDIHNQNFF